MNILLKYAAVKQKTAFLMAVCSGIPIIKYDVKNREWGYAPPRSVEIIFYLKYYAVIIQFQRTSVNFTTHIPSLHAISFL